MSRYSEAEFRSLLISREALDTRKHIVVSYRVAPKDPNAFSPDDLAVLISLMSTVGTSQPLPYEVAERRYESAAKIVHVARTGENSIHIDLAFPVDGFGPNETAAQVLTAVCFCAEFDMLKSFWIDHLEIPDSFAQRHRGPAFGVAGIRKRLGVKTRPIVAGILKPRKGVELSTMLNLAKTAFNNGIDLIFDDELMIDPVGEWSFENRVRAFAAVAREAEAVTGEPKGYVCNVSASMPILSQYIEQACSSGAFGILLNTFALGFFGLSLAIDLINGRMPAFECGIGNALLNRPPFETGVSDAVLAKMSRLCGADGVCTGVSGRDLWYTEDVLRRTVKSLDLPLHHIQTSFALAAGGLDPTNIWYGMHALGPDVMLMLGRSLWIAPEATGAVAHALREMATHLPSKVTPAVAQGHLAALCKKDKVIRDVLASFAFKGLS